jgi:hypothetical protein
VHWKRITPSGLQREQIRHSVGLLYSSPCAKGEAGREF